MTGPSYASLPGPERYVHACVHVAELGQQSPGLVERDVE